MRRDAAPIQNLAWATGYNALAVPVAAGLPAPIGFALPMSVGALVMSLSTIMVAANVQLLSGCSCAPPLRATLPTQWLVTSER